MSGDVVSSAPPVEPLLHLASGEHLTRRETEVLGAVGDDLSNAEIAAALDMSIRTAESHVASLLRKFGLHSRRDLRMLLRTQGTLGPRTGDLTVALRVVSVTSERKRVVVTRWANSA